METISFDDFKKLDLRVGKVVAAEPVEGSEKLLKLSVDFGDETRQIVSGIAGQYSPDFLAGKLCTFILNLEPRTIMDLESQGMMLCASEEGKPVILAPEREVKEGSEVK